MKKISTTLLILLAIFTCLVSASNNLLAQNKDIDTTLFGYRDHPYGPKAGTMTVSLFAGMYTQGENQNFSTNVSKWSNIWTYGVRAGYSLTRALEVESYFAFTPTVNRNFNLYYYEGGIGPLFNFIFNDQIVPYAIVDFGASYMKQSDGFSQSKFALGYGAGIKFFAFKSLAIRPEFKAITSFSSTHTSIVPTLNLTYYMGRKTHQRKDKDGDGIEDATDKCPDQPETVNGFEDEDGCPDKVISDRDKDTILDENDQCPDEAENFNGVMDEDGCPEELSIDADHDGIPDAVDKCPTEPETKNGYRDEDGCPEDPNDPDMDGIVGEDDKCPFHPENINQFEDQDGCPDQDPVDSDKDGIYDHLDQCPEQPEVINGYKDQDGCPDHELDQFSGTVEGIFFDYNDSSITRESYGVLDRAAQIFKRYEQLKFIIEGYTDSLGQESYNQKLSLQRAQSVQNYLIQRGIPSSRMQIKGYGESRPRASNDTEDGRALNRRIEFNIWNLNDVKSQLSR
ncbi:MAG: OmpA family protein [Bdellovibrionales bacterium]|nr:OmpA family protein [Bdellovibrionales bacterium]